MEINKSITLSEPIYSVSSEHVQVTDAIGNIDSRVKIVEEKQKSLKKDSNRYQRKTTGISKECRKNSNDILKIFLDLDSINNEMQYHVKKSEFEKETTDLCEQIEVMKRREKLLGIIISIELIFMIIILICTL